MNRYAWADTGQPFPTFEEVQEKLGPALCATIETRSAEMQSSTNPNEVIAICCYLQGCYNAAALMGVIDMRFASAIASQIMRDAQRRVAELTGKTVVVTMVGEQRGTH